MSELSQYAGFIYYKHKKNDYAVAHTHGYYELVLYCGGGGETTIGGETFQYKENTIALIEPGVRHDDFAFAEMEVYCLGFLHADNEFSNTVFPLDIKQPLHKDIIARMLALKTMTYDKEVSDPSELDAEANFIVLCLLRLFKKKTENNDEYRKKIADYLKSYLKKNYMYKINFDILSEQVGYSLNRMRVIFKEATGQSAYQYLSGYRLAKAKALLSETDMKIKYIAERCGFKNMRRFINFFTEKMTICPSRYRKMTTVQQENNIANFEKKR
ncbi:MAG: helix-turn-helix transcriptional regulator [Clostridiales bacterium]|jgi:AraC-like DNA-binding protein|nr:helix-turn-helix transcriptional regulator [Clostridiales bacterium]